MGDMTAIIGCETTDDVVSSGGYWEAMRIVICAARGLFLSSTYFQHKMIHKYTWRRQIGQDEQKGLID